jgi:bifunctional non-homologous end joining protein LigD
MLRNVRPRLNGFIDPCLPSAAPKPPSGDGWIHEIKLDGFRLLARRDPAGVRLLTRRGIDWTTRYPSIAAAVAALSCRSCLIDGEVVICGEDGVPVFDRLRYGNPRRCYSPSICLSLVARTYAAPRWKIASVR